MGEITLLLQRSHAGDEQAANELTRLVYAELRQLAAAKISRESAAHTLQPTALVHEAWLRLGGDTQPDWQNRRHFFGAAAEAMRRILVDRARRRAAQRHGAGAVDVGIDELQLPIAELPDNLVALNDALERFAAAHPEKAELVKLRYFAGFAIEETAEMLGVSRTTAKRWWVFARAWLFDELNGGGPA